MRYLLKICYDGTLYSGYQRQMNADTVGQRMFDALKKLFGSIQNMAGCSRTDSGVHANAFYITFDTDLERDCVQIIKALNAILPVDIAVIDCCAVLPDFHARYNCLGKQYVYQIWNNKYRNPFYARYSLHVPYKINIVALNSIATDIVGTHDFSSFMASGSKIIDCVRTVTDAHFERNGDLIQFYVSANGFLYNMVRIMVGTFLDIEAGRLNKSVPYIIHGRSRAYAGHTAAAHGLFLNKVFYDESIKI